MDKCIFYTVLSLRIPRFVVKRLSTMAAKFDIEKFNRNNFSLWKMKIKAVLRKDNCLAAIGERPTYIMDDKKWEEIDGNAIANLHLALADGVLSSISEKKSAKKFGIR